MIPHERDLIGSYYGKFFARNLNLYLLQRNSEQWKNMQASQKAVNTKRPEGRYWKAGFVGSTAEPPPSQEREQAAQNKKRKSDAIVVPGKGRAVGITPGHIISQPR